MAFMDISFWEKWKQEKLQKHLKNGVTPLSFVNPLTTYASKEVQDERFAICTECEHFISESSRCKECGCFMNLKTTLLGATCPIGKW
jgi:hypothetical protein